VSHIRYVKFFHHGTQDPKTTYADRGLTIPNTHPVYADVDGILPAIHFADDNWPYTTDAELYDRRDRLLYRCEPLGMNAVLRMGFGAR
jgi:hypothetical protein